MGRYYRVGEVATLTRVSVRTLHHYDRIGLLRPATHSAGGYRLYGEPDLLRLQQILTLRYLGFPLKRIGELLDRPDFDLLASLRVELSSTEMFISGFYGVIALSNASDVVAISRSEAALEPFIETGRWPLAHAGKTRAWTDDYINVPRESGSEPHTGQACLLAKICA